MANGTYDKEAYKIKFTDLSPILQNQLKSMASKTSSNTTGVLLNKIYSELGDIVITVGPEAARPKTVYNNLNMNLNTGINVLETYHDDKWNGRKAVFE